MPATSGTVQECAATIAQMESEADGLLEKFVASLEHGKKYAHTMEKIVQQIDSARKRAAAASELELNEAVVIAEKLEEDIKAAERMAIGARLSKLQDSWASQFEDVRASLDAMAGFFKTMEFSAQHPGEGVFESRTAMYAFAREAKKCKSMLASLDREFSRMGKEQSALHLAKNEVESLRASLGRAHASLAKERLKKKIADAREEIVNFMKRTGRGRIFVDQKHLMLYTDENRLKVPLTQSVRFSLEEIAPIAKPLSKLGSAVVVGSYEAGEDGHILRIGEREVMGDTVVYSERTYFVG